MEIRLRPARAEDHEFLFNLHCLTMRSAIEATWGWDDSWQRREFVQRVTDYEAAIVERAGVRCGGLVTEWLADSLYVHELQVLPEYQGRGLGSQVLQSVIDRAAQAGRPVTLSVLEANPRACALYTRLGFVTTANEPPFIRMRHGLRVQKAV